MASKIKSSPVKDVDPSTLHKKVIAKGSLWELMQDVINKRVSTDDMDIVFRSGKNRDDLRKVPSMKAGIELLKSVVSVAKSSIILYTDEPHYCKFYLQYVDGKPNVFAANQAEQADVTTDCHEITMDEFIKCADWR